MRSLTETLNEIVGEVFHSGGFPRALGRVKTSGHPELCHFQCNGAFGAAKGTGRTPLELASQIAKELRLCTQFLNVSVAGPGFINLTLDHSFIAGQIEGYLADDGLGCHIEGKRETVVIDFGGPNVAKPMHVGHLRSSIIGDCLQRIFRFYGHQVISDVHLGDWGTQMGMLIEELRRRRPELAYFRSGFAGPYPVESPVTLEDLAEMYPTAAARARNDEHFKGLAREATSHLHQGQCGYRALWEQIVRVSRDALERDFKTMNVYFDLWLGESSVQNRIPGMIMSLESAGFAINSSGMVVVPLGEKNDLPPLILLKSDGAVIYATTDLATIDLRVREMGAELILYVVDARQSLHFKQVFSAARLTGIAAKANMEHIQFGTVNGSDGKPFKTRDGSVFSLQDLLEAAIKEASRRLADAKLLLDVGEQEREAIAQCIGVGAVKFADLQHERTSDYIFDLAQFTSLDGYTAPYIQYQVVRIRSLLRKAASQGIECGTVSIEMDRERELALMLLQTPSAIATAYRGRAPHFICVHAYQLARAFSRLYTECPILQESDLTLRASRLTLLSLTQRYLELMLSLLGIDIPSRM